MDLFFDRVSHPAMTDITIDWSGLEVAEVFPPRVPDLFVGRPVILTGRVKNAKPTTLCVTGKLGDQNREMTVPVAPNDTTRHAALASIWARMKIAHLCDAALSDTQNELPGQIRQVALEYGLMSAYTAFVAVDSLTRTAGDRGTTVAVPVPVPDGVRYDTTVQE
jgi:Ca-activated chloride channel homolog